MGGRWRHGGSFYGIVRRPTLGSAHAAEPMRRRALEMALVMAALAIVITLGLATEDTLSSLAKQTHERIGPVHLVPERGEPGVEPFTDVMLDAAVEPFTSDDAEREIRVLVEAALAEPDGPATTSERMSEPSIEFDAAHPPIDGQSCGCATAPPYSVGMFASSSFV